MFYRMLLLTALFVGAGGFAGMNLTQAHVPSLENGDWNGDLEIDVSDAVCMADWLFMGGPPCAQVVCIDRPESPRTYPSVANGDLNGDELSDISDVVYLVQYLFLGGPAPVQIECLQFPAE